MALKWNQAFFTERLSWNTEEKAEFLECIRALALTYNVRKVNPLPEIELSYNYMLRGNTVLKGFKIILKDTGEVELDFPESSSGNERTHTQKTMKRVISIYQNALEFLLDLGIVYFDKENEYQSEENEVNIICEEFIHTANKYINKGFCPAWIKNTFKKTFATQNKLNDMKEMCWVYKRFISLPDTPCSK